MNTQLLVVMLCATIVSLGALVALVVVLLKPQKNQTRAVQDKNTRPPQKGWISWIPFLAVALIMAFWSFWMSLFFLSVVWIMRLDPKPYLKEIPYPNDPDKNSAKGIYTWLFLSSFITVPVMIVAALNLDSNPSINERVFATLIPTVFHLLLLINLDSKRPFVYRHGQQAIFLVALRAGMASIAMSIGNYPGADAGIGLFLLGNGALWLFGSLWGRSQAEDGKCWWMKRKGQTVISKQETVLVSEVKRDVMPSAKPQKKPEATERALTTFRSGNPESRREAIRVLKQLGEVETF